VDDVARALAFVSRRQGHRAMAAQQWALVLSLDLGWMTPGEAQRFVARAQEAGTLQPEGDLLRLAPDPALVDVPRGFRPDPEAKPSKAAGDPFLEWVERAAKAAGWTRDQVLAEVAGRQERLAGLLDAQAAVLWLAAEHGLDVRAAAIAHESGLRAAQAAPGAAASP
ncbi:MAG TPA: DUF2240 family protein, partial [Candidatus Thermoplasmatota archaeon]|nr:DUF2240 family protein [Candidatus Thermoplasmatota archaeon]